MHKKKPVSFKAVQKFHYKHYLLGVMVLVGVISVFDRFVFALVLEPIKQDLGLSDSQLGLMTGIAFTAFYAIAGIPIARWADRGNRVTIAAISMGLLGIMLALCGVVTQFFQLLLVRAGVAVGEAGSVPTAQSLLADYFTRTERPQAMAVYFTFYPISMIAGYLIGGWLVGHFGWRNTFIILGLPGILVAILVKFTLKESRLSKPAKLASEQPSFVAVLRVLWKKKTFRHLLISFCVTYFFVMGSSQWLATFFMRNHGMEAAELGAWLAFTWGVFGVIGNYLGGYLATHYAAGKEKLQMRALAFAVVFSGMGNAVTYLVSDQEIALLFIVISALLASLTNGPIFSMIQGLVAENMRAVTLALFFLFANLVGFGLGPLAIGFLSDLLHSSFGQDSLRYALVCSTPGVLWVALHYWLAGNTIEADINAVEQGSS